MNDKKKVTLPEELKEYAEPEIFAVHYDEDIICNSNDPWETERI